MDALIRTDSYSQTPAALYQRNKRLTDEAYNEIVNSSNKRYRNRQAAKKVLRTANGESAFSNASRNKYLTTRIAHHLSKGRSIADIVIRENAPVSLVKQLIAGMEVVK